MFRNPTRLTVFITQGLALVLVVSGASGQRAEPAPEELEGVGVTEHLGDRIPLDVPFKDEDGKQVTLADYFSGERPVVLTLNYYTCPMLCTLQFKGMANAFEDITLGPGEDFEIVTVSIDPRETPRVAKLRKQKFFEEHGRTEIAPAWHFLTGREENIRRLADAVGFSYRYDESANQYIHTAALYVLTPDGLIARYLYGVTYVPKTLRLSLIEAAEGNIGSSLDQILLFCFHYDASKGKYAPAAMNIMRAGGLLTVIILGAVLTTFWFRGAGKKKAKGEESQT